jgi:cytochrome c556
MRFWLTAFGAVLGFGALVTAYEHGNAQTNVAKLVEDRQAVMGSMGRELFQGVNRVVRGEQPIETAVAPAEAVSRHAQQLISLFPAGSGREAAPATRARPEVWSNRAEFEAAARKFAEESAKLADAAKSGNVETLRAQFGPTASACGGCHEARPADGGKFRFPRQS